MSRSAMSIAMALAWVLGFALSSTGAAADYYGAIAFSQGSGAVGYSYDYQTRAAAEERALDECGEGCEVAVWFRNACGALATGDDAGYGSAWAVSRREAEQIALDQCNRHAENCSIRRWVCTAR